MTFLGKYETSTPDGFQQVDAGSWTASGKIAHHRIAAKLGEGGMGVVYRATDTKLNRDVAIKAIPDSGAGCRPHGAVHPRSADSGIAQSSGGLMQSFLSKEE